MHGHTYHQCVNIQSQGSLTFILSVSICVCVCVYACMLEWEIFVCVVCMYMIHVWYVCILSGYVHVACVCTWMYSCVVCIHVGGMMWDCIYDEHVCLHCVWYVAVYGMCPCMWCGCVFRVHACDVGMFVCICVHTCDSLCACDRYMNTWMCTHMPMCMFTWSAGSFIAPRIHVLIILSTRIWKCLIFMATYIFGLSVALYTVYGANNFYSKEKTKQLT